MPDSEYALTYVRANNTVALTCPYCGLWKIVSADPFRGARHKLKVKCTCKKIFKVFLEFRRKARKKTHLKGTYINHSQKGAKSDIVILDISLIGLTFSSLEAPVFNVNDKLSIEFTLDDKRRSEIIRDAFVRNVRQRSVGCEFETLGGTFDGPLGFYLMT